MDDIDYLQEHHFSEWLQMYKKVEYELSDKQELFCICGKLATGFHEMTCRKFHKKIANETVKRLKHLCVDKAGGDK